jgi:hypothetical protein
LLDEGIAPGSDIAHEQQVRRRSVHDEVAVIQVMKI